MEEHIQSEQSSASQPSSDGKHRKQAEKAFRQAQATRKQRYRMVGRVVAWSIIPVLFVSWFTWKVVTSPTISAEGLVSRKEVHWHAKLSIVDRGKEVPIPANIGIPVGQPNAHPENMHTHAADNVIHIEKLPPVYEKDLRLGNFFAVWNKRFDSQCILDTCTDQGGKLTMKVNGQDNTQFENYLLRDGDQVEIVFE